MRQLILVYVSYWRFGTGIVKISNELHQDVRKASTVMCRSINALAEFWMKVGMLAEDNPDLSFNEIVKQQLDASGVRVAETRAA